MTTPTPRTGAASYTTTWDSLTQHVIGVLSTDEGDQLASTFPTLSRLKGDDRTGWLLGRLGLVDALLRTEVTIDPADFLCEADVFLCVWRGVVRADETHTVGSASPDDREDAAREVAKRSLGLPITRTGGTAAAELRSDGVLRAPNAPALSPGDEFSSDLFRDFALCRVFLTDGWDALRLAGAPRWSIRAARLGCQAALLASDAPHVWAELSTALRRSQQSTVTGGSKSPSKRSSLSATPNPPSVSFGPR